MSRRPGKESSVPARRLALLLCFGLSGHAQAKESDMDEQNLALVLVALIGAVATVIAAFVSRPAPKG